MSTGGGKKAATWLLGFLTLLSILNVFYALLELNGPDSIVYLGVFQLTLGSLDTHSYFWISLIVAFVFFGIASFSIFSGLSSDPELLQRFAKVEETLALHSTMLENTQIGFFKKLEETEKANDESNHMMNISLEEMRKATSESLEGMKKETSESLEKQKKTLEAMEKETLKNTETINKQAKELTDLNKKIAIVAKETTTQKAKLTGQAKLGKLKGITPRLESKLNSMNIMTVSDFLAADPVVVSEKAAEMVETIAHKQAEAQLLMVPGINEDDAELLVKAGVVSQKELANEDPVQLYRSVVSLAKSRVEQGQIPESKVPTMEDVSSWVRQARL